MAPRQTTKSAPAPVEEQAKRSYTPPPAGLLDKLAQVEIVPDDTSAFGRGSRETVPADHPLVGAYEDTYRAGKAAKFKTDEPDACINVLRRIAADRDKGIRTSVTDLNGKKIILPKRGPGEKSPRFADVTNGNEVYVVFMGREKKAYTRKVNNATSAGGELPENAE